MTLGIILSLAMASSQAADPPLIPSFFTGEALHDICRQQSSAGQCSMYVAGVLDGIFLSDAETGRATICPAKLTNQDAAGEVVRFLTDNPGERHKAASVIVRRALEPRLQCPATERDEQEISSRN
jgi:hypothetical protein